MKGSQVALARIGDRLAAALLRDGRLDDFLVDPPDDSVRAGAIYRAKVGRPVKGMGGAFLDLGGHSGFLRQAKGLAAGSMVTVQVTGYAEPGKALPVTERVLFKSRYCIVTPGARGQNISRAITDDAEKVRLRELLQTFDVPEDFGLILRTACVGAFSDAIEQDLTETLAIAALVSLDTTNRAELLFDGPDAHALAWREWSDVAPADVLHTPRAFEELDIAEAVDDLAKPQVSLAGGGALFIEPTRAMVAIDVNTGPDTSPSAGLKANLDAAREIPRGLRLRGLGGQVTVDFAPMAKKHRKQLEAALKAAFRNDPVETSLAGWTPLGLFELQRKRERLPLSEVTP